MVIRNEAFAAAQILPFLIRCMEQSNVQAKEGQESTKITLAEKIQTLALAQMYSFSAWLKLY